MFKHRSAYRIALLLMLVAAIRIRDQADAAPTAYYVTDLGTLGGTDSRGWSINAIGQVAGYASTIDDITVDAFLWTPTTPNGATGALKDLGTLGGTYAWGVGINAGGQVAGVSATTGDTAEHATLWNPTTPNATTGMLHGLGTLGGTFSQANSVNASGQVAGFSDTTGDVDSHAFMWKPTTPGGAIGTMYDLGSLGGPFTIAWDINTGGQVTGASDTIEGQEDSGHAFLWQPTVPNGTSGTMHDLGTLGGSWSDGSGINDSGQVAGSAQTTDDAGIHAFLWTPITPGGTSGTMLDLGTLGGPESYGYAVTADGQVVGLSYVPPEVSNYSHAFLYTAANGMLDLNTRIDPLSGWELLDAYDINDAGQITGQGLIDDEYHAFLLTPARAGDVNFDGAVDIFDVNTVSANWGAGGPAGDANGDGIVDIFDVNLISANWGATNSVASSAVPEPTSQALLVTAIGVLLFRRYGLFARDCYS